MTAAQDPQIWPLLSLLLVPIWLALACLLPVLPRRWHMRASWLLVLAGVPVLGRLTLNWGPGLGVAGFGLGLLMLLARPTLRPTLQRPAPAAMTTATPTEQTPTEQR